MYSSIVRNLEEKRLNIIQLEKSKWLEDAELNIEDQFMTFYSLGTFTDNIKKLSIFSSYELTKLESNMFTKLKNLKHLALISYKISTIEVNSFNALLNLTHLKLDCGSLENLPEFLFTNLKNLKELDLKYNSQFKILRNHFHGLENLNTLKIKGDSDYLILNENLDILNNLKEFELTNIQFNEFTFKGFENLEILRLKNLKFFKNTQKNLFLQLKNLQNFQVIINVDDHHNEQSTLFKEIFFNLPSSIKIFDTKYIFFEFLSLNSIPFICGIKSLKISFDKIKDYNNLTPFDNGFFQNLEKLTIIRDHNNDYKLAPCKWFEKLKNLKSLKLHGFILSDDYRHSNFNLIEKVSFRHQIPNMTLNNFLQLKKLSLEIFDRQITLNENFLNDLINLEELSLIKVFDSIELNSKFLFKNLIKLKKLNLVSNSITIVKSSYFQFLVNLEVLDLSANGIKVIESGSFESLKQLKFLYLTFNSSLKEIKNEVFNSNCNLKTVQFISNVGNELFI